MKKLLLGFFLTISSIAYCQTYSSVSTELPELSYDIQVLQSFKKNAWEISDSIIKRNGDGTIWKVTSYLMDEREKGYYVETLTAEGLNAIWRFTITPEIPIDNDFYNNFQKKRYGNYTHRMKMERKDLFTNEVSEMFHYLKIEN